MPKEIVRVIQKVVHYIEVEVEAGQDHTDACVQVAYDIMDGKLALDPKKGEPHADAPYVAL